MKFEFLNSFEKKNSYIIERALSQPLPTLFLFEDYGSAIAQLGSKCSYFTMHRYHDENFAPPRMSTDKKFGVDIPHT